MRGKLSVVWAMSVASPALLAQPAYLVRDIFPGGKPQDLRFAPAADSFPRFYEELVVFRGELFFLANDGGEGGDIWQSDGTYGGTRKVVDLAAGACGEQLCTPINLTVAGDRMFFAHGDAGGVELWRSDGTQAGTSRVKDIRPGPESSLYFPQSGPDSLYIGALTAVGDTVFFVADDGAHGPSIWKSDGTSAGTVLVKDLPDDICDRLPRALTAVGNLLFFITKSSDCNADPAPGDLWRSDGTPGGTVKLRSFPEGIAARDFFARSLFQDGAPLAVGSKLYFAASDAGALPRGLWTSDGVTVTKVKAFDADSSLPRSFTQVERTVYFVNYHKGILNLWRSDGTGAGTVLVKDFGVFRQASSFAAAGGTLFFVTDGRLWRSDGTSAGTIPISNVSQYHADLGSARGALYFAGFDFDSGDSLWTSDGTAKGTFKIQDTAPGLHANTSPPRGFTLAGDTLFFTNDDGVHGKELWALPLAADCGEVVIDDGKPGTSSTGSWRASGATSPFGADSLYARGTSALLPTYRFEAILDPGMYEVFEWHGGFASRTHAAPHAITHDFGTETVLVDQNGSAGQWNSLGTFSFASSRGSVTIRAADLVGTTGADAIRFVCRSGERPIAVIDGISPSPAEGGKRVCFDGHGESLHPIVAWEWTSSIEPRVLLDTQASFCVPDLVAGTHSILFRVEDATGAWSLPVFESLEVAPERCSFEVIVDNGRPGTSSTGAWTASSASSAYGGNSLWTKPTTGTAGIWYRFDAAVPPGTYEVFEWHSAWPTRSTAAPHVVEFDNFDADVRSFSQLSKVFVDQSIHGGQWNSLGTYDFTLTGHAAVRIHATDTARSTNADAIRFVCRTLRD